MQPDNTIGTVQWGRTFTGTDGEQISLMITAFFQSHHVPYLKSVLQSRLLPLIVPGVLRLDPGELTRSERGSSYEPGYLVITGMSEPWPNGAELREAVDAAFREAGEIEAAQQQRAVEMKRHLIDTGMLPQDDLA